MTRMSCRRGRGFRWQPTDEGGQPKTSPWKETYRQRCLDILKENRFKQLLSKRQLESPGVDDGSDEDDVGAVNRQNRREKLVKDIQARMASEWEALRTEDSAERGIEPEDIPAPSVDELITLMEDILEELRQSSETTNVEEFCEDHLEREENELCEAFDRMRAVEVICPICQKDSLQEVGGLISCTCGLNINTEQDCISLKYVADSLRRGTNEHEVNCDKIPLFSMMTNFGISTLMMTCKECDFHYIIV